MNLTAAQRLSLMEADTNRQYAYAVVMGQLAPREAALFNVWVVRNGLHHSDPADNLDLWFDR